MPRGYSVQKKMVIDGNMTEKLAKFRDELNVFNGEELNKWMKTLPDLKDTEGNNAVQKLTFMNRESMPEALGIFVDTVFEQTKMTYDMVRYYEVSFIKPLPEGAWKRGGNSSGGKKKQVHVNKYDIGGLNISDRFLYVYGIENLDYRFIDISKVAVEFGVSAKNMLQNVNDRSGKSRAFRFGLQEGMGIQISYDDNKSFISEAKKGFRQMSINKTEGRWSMIVDIFANKERLDDIVDSRLEPVAEIIESNPNSKKSLMIKKFQEKMQKEAKAGEHDQLEKDKLLADVFEDEEEAPSLVEIEEVKSDEQILQELEKINDGLCALAVDDSILDTL